MSTDFTHGRAFTVERRSFCASCMAKPLAAPAPPVKRPATGRAAVPSRAAPRPSWPTGTAAAAVVALVAIVIWIAAPTSTPLAEPRAADPREMSARRSVAAAEAFARGNPVDLTGQSARWREALRAAEGTPLAAAARLASERVDQLRKEGFKIELTRMEEALRASLAREEFQEALKAVEAAKQKAPSPEDGLALDKRAQEIRDQAKALVPAVVKEATAAARSADPSMIKTLRERIFRWGLGPSFRSASARSS